MHILSLLCWVLVFGGAVIACGGGTNYFLRMNYPVPCPAFFDIDAVERRQARSRLHSYLTLCIGTLISSGAAATLFFLGSPWIRTNPISYGIPFGFALGIFLIWKRDHFV